MNAMEMKGFLEYGERAFLQDAVQAIRGSVVRALIELVTNSDDAYGKDDGPIRISVAQSEDPDHPVELRVADSARGLRGAELRERLAKLGVEKSAEDAKDARGLFGRGARDVASLGPITFAAIRDGHYSAMRIDGLQYTFLAFDEPATPEHRAEIGLAPHENGFINIVGLKKSIKVPSGSVLQRSLSAHAQLRELVGRRTVRLTDERKAGFSVRLQPPDVPPVVFEADLDITGYEPARLRLRRLPTRAEGAVTPESLHGLLIRCGVSTFENTWFHLEGRLEASYFCGEVEAPQIIEIIRAFDRNEPLGGSTRLLDRDRDGLIRDHEYTKTLAKAVAAAVQPYFDEVAKAMAAERRQGEKLSNAFDVARRAIRDQMRKALEEIEEDDAPTGTGAGAGESLMVIPPRREMRPGESATLTVRAHGITSGAPLDVEVTLESAGDIIESVAASTEPWKQHPRLEALQSSIYVTAGSTLGSANVRVSVGDEHALAEIVVANPSELDDEPPDALEFETPRVSIAPSRVRHLVLRAPIDMAGVALALSVQGAGSISPESSVTLTAHPSGRWASSVVRYRAEAQSGAAIVTASTGDGAVDCHVDIKESREPSGPDFAFELRAFKNPDRRATLILEAGRLKVEVFGLHQAFNGVFGAYRDAEEKFEREDQPDARAVLAEVIGSELAGYLVEREYARFPERLNDATRVLRRQAELQLRIQAILHRSLRADIA
jgi:hypothetical protein